MAGPQGNIHGNVCGGLSDPVREGLRNRSRLNVLVGILRTTKGSRRPRGRRVLYARCIDVVPVLPLSFLRPPSTSPDSLQLFGATCRLNSFEYSQEQFMVVK